MLVLQLGLLAVILVGWEWASGPKDASGTLIDEFYVSQPSAIWDALRGWHEQGVLWSSIFHTLKSTLYGFLLGASLGWLAGFVLGVNRLLAAVLQPFLTAVYSIPRLALVPLFMLWLGIGMATQLALVASVVFFLVFYATFAGVRDVDHELVERLRLMRASKLDVHLKATLPSAMTFIISGLRISAPYSLVVAVTTEMLMSNRGMGALLIRSSGQFYTDGVFAALFIMMVVGIALMEIVRLVEARLLRWKPKRPDDVRI